MLIDAPLQYLPHSRDDDSDVEYSGSGQLGRAGSTGEFLLQEPLGEQLRPHHDGVAQNPEGEHVDQ